MKTLGMHLVWITVSDVKKAVKFYTEVLGFELLEFHEEYGWAELSGGEGAMLGIAQAQPDSEFKPGHNSIAAITVENLDASIKELQTKNVRLMGPVQEVPGEVRLQTFSDKDGNIFQLCQLLK